MRPFVVGGPREHVASFTAGMPPGVSAERFSASLVAYLGGVTWQVYTIDPSSVGARRRVTAGWPLVVQGIPCVAAVPDDHPWYDRAMVSLTGTVVRLGETPDV